MLNKKCIFRGDRSGVFYGTLLKEEGKEVVIGNCRRIWYWDGANSISDISLIGTTRPENCKITAEVNQLKIKDCIEILPCTEQAIKALDGVAEWTRK